MYLNSTFGWSNDNTRRIVILFFGFWDRLKILGVKLLLFPYKSSQIRHHDWISLVQFWTWKGLDISKMEITATWFQEMTLSHFHSCWPSQQKIRLLKVDHFATEFQYHNLGCWVTINGVLERTCGLQDNPLLLCLSYVYYSLEYNFCPWYLQWWTCLCCWRPTVAACFKPACGMAFTDHVGMISRIFYEDSPLFYFILL